MSDLSALISIYRDAAAGVRSALFAVDLERFDAQAAAVALVKVRNIVSALNISTTLWTDDSVDRSYASGERRSKAVLEKMGFRAVHPARMDRRRIIKDNLAVTLLRANNSIVTTAENYLAVSAMAARVIREAPIQEFSFGEIEAETKRAAAKAVREEASRKTLAAQVRSQIRGIIGDDKIIEINGRRYQADKYAELVARNTFAEAQTQATLELCEQYQNDLVQWSDHGTVCPACHEYEGNIYSISGKHPIYPPVTEYPPLHPNCEHSILPTTDVALATRPQGWHRGTGPARSIGDITQAAAAQALKAVKAPRKQKPAPLPKAEKPIPPPPPPPPPPVVEWKPVMTPEEADIWAKDSAIQATLNHNTKEYWQVEAITKDGFVVGEGAAYGHGVYSSTREELSYGRFNLGVRVNVKKVLVMRNDTWDRAQAFIESNHDKLLKKFGNYFWRDPLVTYAKAHGYGAIAIKRTGYNAKTWYNVFDPHNITVVRYLAPVGGPR